MDANTQKCNISVRGWYATNLENIVRSVNEVGEQLQDLCSKLYVVLKMSTKLGDVVLLNKVRKWGIWRDIGVQRGGGD
jgi:hypothetical protein